MSSSILSLLNMEQSVVCHKISYQILLLSAWAVWILLEDSSLLAAISSEMMLNVALKHRSTRKTRLTKSRFTQSDSKSSKNWRWNLLQGIRKWGITSWLSVQATQDLRALSTWGILAKSKQQPHCQALTQTRHLLRAIRCVDSLVPA